MSRLPKSRSVAKAAGSRHYFTGRPCVHGHVCRRFTSNGTCEQCASEQCISWRAENPELAYERARAWKSRNPGKLAKYRKEGRRRNASRIKQQEKRYREKNPEKKQAAMRAWKRKNSDRVAAYGKEYRARNREKLSGYNSVQKAKRRASEDVGVPLGTFLGWRHAQPKVCFYCGAECATNFHVDHFMPLSKGGQHVLTNLRIACPGCNLRKNAKLPLEWINEISANYPLYVEAA